VDVAKNMHGGGLVLSLQSRNRNAKGSFSRPKALSMSQGQLAQLPLSEDREILPALPGGQSYSYGYGYAGTTLAAVTSCQPNSDLYRRLAATFPMRSSMGLISGFDMNSFQINPVRSFSIMTVIGA
jgi:hypothetical protein